MSCRRRPDGRRPRRRRRVARSGRRRGGSGQTSLSSARRSISGGPSGRRPALHCVPRSDARRRPYAVDLVKGLVGVELGRRHATSLTWRTASATRASMRLSPQPAGHWRTTGGKRLTSTRRWHLLRGRPRSVGCGPLSAPPFRSNGGAARRLRHVSLAVAWHCRSKSTRCAGVQIPAPCHRAARASTSCSIDS